MIAAAEDSVNILKFTDGLKMQRSEAVVTPMNPDKRITYLVGKEIGKIRPFAPFEEVICSFLNDLSSSLRSSKDASTFTDIISFAFWCRKANLDKLKAGYVDGKIRLGIGLVFHITPSNVPVNFAYSFVFGLLAGNANIIRVPSKNFPQTQIICKVINDLFGTEKYRELRSMNIFVKYDHNDEITAAYSASCNARIIWGGDFAIQSIRKHALPERSADIAFADRYSFCVLHAPSIVELNEEELRRLAVRFYNDTYFIDQNACSSPHLVVWSGQNKEIAKERFWNAVHTILKEKYILEPVTVVDKYTTLCKNAIELDTTAGFKTHGSLIFRVILRHIPGNIDSMRGNCGFFYEYDTDDLNSIAYIVNNKYQTLTYFGFDKKDLVTFVAGNRLAGIDRIVPVGTALEIGLIWDGYDIIRCLSRIISI
jgi:hypothetical protein